MKSLDPLQCPLDGPALIEASAGTGKTYTIATLYTRLIAEAGRDVRQILVVTFTEAATAELRERIRSRLFAELDGLSREDPKASPLTAHLLAAPLDERRRYQERLRAALESFDQAAIFTIHGFCQRLLHENAFECQVDFEAELEKDGGPLFDELRLDFWARETNGMSPLLLRLLGSEDEAAALGKVLREVTGRPSAELRPQQPATPDLTPLESFEAVWRELRTSWPAVRGEVERILLEDPGLNRTSYRLASVPGKLAEIDAYCGSEFPERIDWGSSSDAPWLLKLTPSFLASKTKAKHSPPSHPFFDLCGRWDEARLRLPEIIEAHRLHLRWRFAEFLRTELPARKQALGILHFDDLLGAVDRALGGEHAAALVAAAQARYHAALIDEFQDTDPVQYRIFSRLFGGQRRPLFLIGDPKQAIYAFRGADIFAYLTAVKEAPSAPLTLNVNWRSDPALLRAVARLFERPARPFLLPGIEFPAVEPRPGVQPALNRDGQPVAPLQLRFLSAEGREGQKTGQVTKSRGQDDLPRLIAEDIVRLLTGPDRLGERAIQPGDVAVLVRTNGQAAAVQAELTALGVPAVSTAEDSVLESEEATELALLLTALVDPGSARRVRAALTTRLFGLHASDLARLAADEAAWDGWVSRFREWRELWEQRGFVHAHRAVLAHASEPTGGANSTRLLGALGGERALTNHLHLAELLHTAAHERHLGPHGLLRWFERARAGKHEDKESAELRLETDDAAVKIVTVHKSKGLEYPVVYCPFLWTPPRDVEKKEVLAFHDPKANDRLVLELGDDPDARAQALYEGRAEELRLAYVALTRAKHLCVVVTGHFEGLGDSALGYLLHHQPDPDDPWTRTRDYVRGLSEAEQRAELESLAASSEGALGVSSMAEDRPPRYAPPPMDHGALAARARARKVSITRAISSYSGLVQGAPAPEPDERPVLDRGEAELPLGPEQLEPEARPALLAPIPLAEFPRTAAAGTFFHSIYEVWDFQNRDPDALRELTGKKLERFGHDPGRWRDTVSAALAGTLHTGLESGAAPLRLADLPKSKRLDELAFLLSAQPAASGRSAGEAGVRATELAELFRRHRAPAQAPDYADALAKLDFPALRGFLKGYIDLVFEHDDRYFVLDYKSNYLGDRFADYTPPRLAEAMTHGHYYLQYHLYVLAVHRYLRLRRADYDYDYDRDFGGVYYLFLKGMSPATGADSGVYFDKPARGLIEDLDRLFGAPPSPEPRRAP